MEGTAGHPAVVGYSDAKQTGVMVLAGTTWTGGGVMEVSLMKGTAGLPVVTGVSNTGWVRLTALSVIVWTAGRVMGLSVIKKTTAMAGSSDTE